MGDSSHPVALGNYLSTTRGRLYCLIRLLGCLICGLGYRNLPQPHLVKDVVDICGCLIVAKGDREEDCCALRLFQVGTYIDPFLLPGLDEQLVITLDTGPDEAAGTQN